MPTPLSNLKLKVLSEISQVIHKALDLDDALRDMLGILSKTLGMERATITLQDSLTGRLAIRASYGLTPEEKSRGVYEQDEGVTGRVFTTGQPLFIPDISREPLFLDRTGSRRADSAKGAVAFIGVPILFGGRTIGVLSVDRTIGEDALSTQENVDFLTVVATLVAQFISLHHKHRQSMDELKRENVSLKYQLSKETRGLYIVGRSGAMQDVERHIARVAPTRATVLLLGESGTGKTLIGRIIHELSDRRSHPFVKVNCASIPENLLESELFGYEKGAFTGAVGPKAGRFEDAHKGSVFLDEIGELPLGLQAKLLRVLQDMEFERLGSNRTRKVDVRILAATNKNLEALVDAGTFRADLYYRLNVFPLRVPPLRERKEDVTRLLNHFLDKVAREYGRTLSFTPEALDLLRGYDWPGNVREMENLVERLVIMADGQRIDSHLIEPSLHLTGKEAVPQPVLDGEVARRPSLRDMERNEVLSALRRAGWVQRRAAEMLGLTQRQMGYRVKKYHLEELVARERVRVRTGRAG